MPKPIITADRLSFAFKVNGGAQQTIFENLSFEVGHGQIVCIVGPSGCGKSTLLNLVAGFLAPLKGVIHLSQNKSGERGRVGYIFQRDALLPWRTVRGNLRLAGELQKDSDQGHDDGRLHAWLDVFSLDDSVLEKYPAELSGGMRQRVSVVQSLMTDPDILLLDEPFSALDFYTKLKLEAEFRSMVAGSGKAALFVTHDIDEAIAMGDKILIMGASPKGIIKELRVEFDGGAQMMPEAIRGHARFGEYFSQVWSELRDSV